MKNFLCMLFITSLLVGCFEDKSQSLFSAIKSENIEEVKRLASSGIDLSQSINGNTYLYYAIHSKNPELVKILIDNGVDVNVYVKGEQPPIWSATVYAANLDITKLLVRTKKLKPVKYMNLSLADELDDGDYYYSIIRYIKRNQPSLLDRDIYIPNNSANNLKDTSISFMGTSSSSNGTQYEYKCAGGKVISIFKDGNYLTGYGGVSLSTTVHSMTIDEAATKVCGR